MFPVQIAPAAPSGTQSSTPSDDIANASNADSDVPGLGSEATLAEPDGFAEELENVMAVEMAVNSEVVNPEAITGEIELVAPQTETEPATASATMTTAEEGQVLFPETLENLDPAKVANSIESPSTAETLESSQALSQPVANTLDALPTLDAEIQSVDPRQPVPADVAMSQSTSLDGETSQTTLPQPQAQNPKLPPSPVEGAEIATSEASVDGDKVAVEVEPTAATRFVGSSKGSVEPAAEFELATAQRSVSFQGPTQDVGPEAPSTQPVELTQSTDVFVSAAPANNAPPTVATSSRSFSTHVDAMGIRNQVTDHIVSVQHTIQDGRAELEVQLDPPELGKITIELFESNESLSGKLIVSSSSTLDSIREQLSSLLDSLADAGLSFDDLELESSANGEQNRGDRSETDDSTVGWESPWTESGISSDVERSLGTQSIDVLA